MALRVPVARFSKARQNRKISNTLNNPPVHVEVPSENLTIEPPVPRPKLTRVRFFEISKSIDFAVLLTASQTPILCRI